MKAAKEIRTKETMMDKLNVVKSAVKVSIKEKVRRLSGGLRRLSTSIIVDYEIAVDEETAESTSAAVNNFTLEDVQSTLKAKLQEKGSDLADAVTVKELTEAEVVVVKAHPTKPAPPAPPAIPLPFRTPSPTSQGIAEPTAAPTVAPDALVSGAHGPSLEWAALVAITLAIV